MSLPRHNIPNRSSANVRFVFIANAKMMRLHEMIGVLMKQRATIKELSKRFDQSERTVYRYLDIMESMEINIEKDFNDKYFIAMDSCPLCGK